MHGDLTLNGPLYYALVLFAYASWGMSLYVAVDAARRHAVGFASIPESRWLYIVTQGAYFVGFGVTNLLPAVAWLNQAVAYALPVALVMQVAYLLRVVFPRPKE